MTLDGRRFESSRSARKKNPVLRWDSFIILCFSIIVILTDSKL